MQYRNTRRGFTQIKWVGQALPDNAPVKGHLAAFTLIELLVVVVIIGILAAVAVPQYQKAVLKTRMTQAVLYGKEYVKAQNVYRLANGELADSLNKLDISIPTPTGWSMFYDPNLKYLALTHVSSQIYFNFWPAGGNYSVNSGFCFVNMTSSQLKTAKSVCKSLTGSEGWVDSSGTRYGYPFQW